MLNCSSHLLRKYGKFLSELLELAYTELNRLLDKLKFVSQCPINNHINPGLALVLLLNAFKVDLLSISGSWISARNKRKMNLKQNLLREIKAKNKDLNLIVNLSNELNSISAIECDLLIKSGIMKISLTKCQAQVSYPTFLNFNSSVKILPGGTKKGLCPRSRRLVPPPGQKGRNVTLL